MKIHLRIFIGHNGGIQFLLFGEITYRMFSAFRILKKIVDHLVIRIKDKTPYLELTN